MPARRMLSVLAVVAATLLTPASAGAAGPPIGASSALSDTVYSPDGQRAVIVDQGEHATVVRLVNPSTRRALRQWTIRGRFGLPRVTYSELGGVDLHGSTLVLADADAPSVAGVTRFLVFHLNRADRPRVVTLTGAFGYDALSPTGDRLYLVQGVSASTGSPASEFSRYIVREFDLRRDRLIKAAISDPKDGPGAMEGIATARATSTNGAWVYTLYVGGAHAFIHALHTSAGQARCIDLPWTGKNTRMTIAAFIDKHTLSLVDDRGTMLARIDTNDMRVEAILDPTV